MKLNMTQTNEKIFHAYGFGEPILLKHPYYPKKSTDLMQSLSKYQQHFFYIIRTNTHKIFMETQTPNSQSNLEKEEQN